MSLSLAHPQSPVKVAARPAERCLCSHCGEIVPSDMLDHTYDAGYAFCCTGCETVFSILHPESGVVPRHAAEPADAYAHLDDPEFLNAYGVTDGALEFYLEGVQCASCVWLVERLPAMVPGVTSAKLDLSRSIATVAVASEGSFASAAAQLRKFGYRPHAVREGEADTLQKRENQKYLVRIGIAAVSLANIMMMAVATYAGAPAEWTTYFGWASLAFFLPVLLYSAAPFYVSALAAFRARRMSIDVPIVIGLVAGAAAGIANLIRPGQAEEIYFDSLTALVFLLLSARYLVRRTQQKALNATRVVSRLMPAACRRWVAERDVYEDASVESLRRGDRIEVRAGEVLPADGIVYSGASHVNAAVLSGESRPQPVGRGDRIYAGTANLNGRLEVEVEASGAATRVGQIVKLVQEAGTRRTRVGDLADRISGWFTATVLVLAAATFAFWAQSDVVVAFNHTMALLIITCPCALAMSAPVATLVSMARAAGKGILIKSPDVFERFAAAERIYFDKTGTLTLGKFEVLDWAFTSAVDEREVRRAVAAVERVSVHPLAAAIVEDLNRAGVVPAADAADVVENIGSGISGSYGGRRYEIGRSQELSPTTGDGVETTVSVRVDGVQVAVVRLGDRMRPDSAESVEALAAAGYRPALLSGDTETAVRAAARHVGIDSARVWAACTPESKLARIQSDPRSIMIGDGANDSAALAAASVGVAVHGGMEVSLRAADVYLLRPGVGLVTLLAKSARETISVIYRNFGFSLVYNLIGATAAVMGYMSPLAAAVFMPLSSLTVYLSSSAGAKSLR